MLHARTYTGTTPTDMLVQRKRNFYKLERLPKFLVLCLKRFKKNNFTVEKNSTIVNFPLRSLDMRNYVDDAKLKMPYLPNDAELQAMSVKRLRKVLSRAKIKHEDVVERAELIRRAKGVIREIRNKYVTKYDLVSNIVHDIGTTEEIVEGADPIQVGAYHVNVHHQGSNQWYDIEDLHVKEIMPYQIGMSESNLLVYRRREVEDTS